MACEEFGPKLMAYIDGELTGEEKDRMEKHLAECPECAEEAEAFGKVRDLAKQLRFREPPPEFWDEYPRGVLGRLGRGIGWLLVIVCTAVLAVYGLVRLWMAEHVDLLTKVAVSGLILGFAIILGTVVRQRYRESRTDPYKEIVR